MLVTNMTPAEIRKSGGFALLDAAHHRKADAKLLAWGDSGGKFNTYLSKKPAMTADGGWSQASNVLRIGFPFESRTRIERALLPPDLVDHNLRSNPLSLVSAIQVFPLFGCCAKSTNFFVKIARSIMPQKQGQSASNTSLILGHASAPFSAISAQ